MEHIEFLRENFSRLFRFVIVRNCNQIIVPEHVESRFSSTFQTATSRHDRQRSLFDLQLPNASLGAINREQVRATQYVSSCRHGELRLTFRVSSRALLPRVCSPAVNCKRSFIPLVVTFILSEPDGLSLPITVLFLI